jgi:Ca2+-binding RTX toxin-like protein
MLRFRFHSAVVIMTDLVVEDAKKGGGHIITMKPYTGTVPGITSQFITVTPDNVIMVARGPNVFLHSGSGNDFIEVQSGRNILDGGSGSNFLVGGNGTDTFYLDARSTAFSWSTIVNFHTGDDVTIWGWLPGVSTESWAENLGAAGHTGATLKIDINGKGAVTDQLTFAGFSVAQASHFVQQAGSVAGTPYLHITA